MFSYVRVVDSDRSHVTERDSFSVLMSLFVLQQTKNISSVTNTFPLLSYHYIRICMFAVQSI